MNEIITNSEGEILDYTFHDANSRTRDLLIIGHGVTGNKDRPFVVSLAEAVENEGLSVLRFSFSGNGGSEGDFRDSTISKEVEDLKAVITVAEANGYKVTYAGHSMGGAVGVLAAASDERIRNLISLAGMVNSQAFYGREFGEEIPDKGCMWEEPECPLSSKFKNDMYEISSVLNLASTVQVPWLWVHGDSDDVVPIQDSREIFAAANEPKELIEIPGANHVFSGEGEELMAEAVISWLGDKLA
ncbi:MAG: alpha/beta fold hydrolase [Opitutales bacterium]|nr:alpha/beta fold hydrolase [Opitutales bacterium]